MTYKCKYVADDNQIYRIFFSQFCNVLYEKIIHHLSTRCQITKINNKMHFSFELPPPASVKISCTCIAKYSFR